MWMRLSPLRSLDSRPLTRACPLRKISIEAMQGGCYLNTYVRA